MRYLLILIPLFVFSAEYYDLCNGKEYTVSDNVLISSDMKDRNVTETGVPFAPWIICTDRDMNITTQKVPKTITVDGNTYELKKKHSAYCVPFGNKHYLNKTKTVYWLKCRREEHNDWNESA